MTTLAAPAMHSPSLAKRLRRYSPLGPLLAKELRQIARRKRSYVLRFAYLGVLLLILSLVWASYSTSRYYGAPGLVQQAAQQAEMGRAFFVTFALFTIIIMQVLAPVLTSNAIGAERLARTLDVLRMTPMSAWQIACGKLFSRLLSALTLIGLSLPVLAVVRLLGGVEADAMLGAIALAAATAMAAAAMGLLFSTFMNRAWGVILLCLLVQFAIYFVLPACAMLLFRDAMRSSSMGAMYAWASWCPIVACMWNAFEPRRAIGWTSPVITQTVFAAVLLLLSTWAIARGARSKNDGVAALPTADLPAAPPLAARAQRPAPVAAAGTAAAPPPLPVEYRSAEAGARDSREVGDNPVLWHALRQTMFPKKWQRVVAVVAVLGLLLLSYVSIGFDRNGLVHRDAHVMYVCVFHSLLLLLAAVVSATAMAGEKESDTWTLLIVSPVTGWQVVWGKFRGCMRRLRWTWLLATAHVALFTLGGVIDPLAAAISIGMMLACNVVWIATGLIFSLRCRRTTTAVVLNILLPVVLYIGVPLLLLAVGEIVFNGTPRNSREMPANFSLLALPYYYETSAIERFSSSDHFRRVRIDFLDDYVSAATFTAMAVGVTLGYVAVTLALLAWAANRFDRWAKRARQIERFSTGAFPVGP